MPVPNLPGAPASPRPAAPFCPHVPGSSQSPGVSRCASPAEGLGRGAAGCPCSSWHPLGSVHRPGAGSTSSGSREHSCSRSRLR